MNAFDDPSDFLYVEGLDGLDLPPQIMPMRSGDSPIYGKDLAVLMEALAAFRNCNRYPAATSVLKTDFSPRMYGTQASDIAYGVRSSLPDAIKPSAVFGTVEHSNYDDDFDAIYPDIYRSATDATSDPDDFTAGHALIKSDVLKLFADVSLLTRRTGSSSRHNGAGSGTVTILTSHTGSQGEPFSPSVDPDTLGYQCVVSEWATLAGGSYRYIHSGGAWTITADHRLVSSVKIVVDCRMHYEVYPSTSFTKYFAIPFDVAVTSADTATLDEATVYTAARQIAANHGFTEEADPGAVPEGGNPYWCELTILPEESAWTVLTLSDRTRW